MDAERFDRHLAGELCWLDGFPTVASHAGQRQCPHCRRKWSFAAMRRRWLVAQEFCKGASRRVAAERAGVEEHAAGRHYRVFQNKLAQFFTDRISRSEGRFSADPLRLADFCRRAQAQPDRRKRLLLMVQFCFEDMPIEGRLEVLYLVCFRPKIHALVRAAVRAQAEVRAARRSRL